MLSALAAIASMLASLLILIGWLFDIRLFKGLIPGMETTKPLGALGFFLAGTALFLMLQERRWQRILGLACAGLTFFIGWSVLLEYAAGVDIGIDRLLFRDAVLAEPGPFPGRPVLIVSACLTLMGLALIIIRSEIRGVDLLAFAILFVGLIVLTEYVYGSTDLSRLGPYRPMPLPSALMLVLLSLGYLSARPESHFLGPITSPLSGGVFARRFLPAAIIVPMGLGWLQLTGQSIGLYSNEFGRVLFATSSMLVFIGLVYWNVRGLNDADIQRETVNSALRQSEERFRSLNATLEQRVAERTQQLDYERAHWQGIVEGIAEEVWTCDAQGKMSLLNLGTVTAMGLEAFKDKSVEEVYQDVDIFYMDGQPRPPEQAPLLRSLRGEIVRGEEIMLHRKTGKKRYRQYSSAPTHDASGAITGAVSIVRDITEQKLAEEGLRRYELLSANSKDIVLFINIENLRILEANAAAIKAYGYSREELLALTLLDLRAPNTRGLTEAQVAQANAGGILFETTHIRKDGTTFPAEVSSQGATIGGVRTLISIVRDITDRKRAEEDVRKNQQLLHAIIDNTQALIYVKDLEGRLIVANQPLSQVYGLSIREIIGKTSREIVADPQDAEAHIANDRQVIETGQPLTFEESTPERAFLSLKFPLRDAQGHIFAVGGVSTDITERKRAEEQVAAALAEKEVLLKEIHHRVKNNLQVISSLLRMQSAGVDDPQVRELFADSQRRVRAMALIHEQLYQSPNLAQINLRDYIGKLVSYLRHSYTQTISKVEIRINVEDMIVEIDRAMPLGLLVSELVSNSLKYAFPNANGLQTGQVWVNIERSKDGLTLAVGDNGVGLPDGLDIKHVPSMGLQLVDSFVSQLQGQLTIQRKPGTVFTIFIPARIT